MPSPQVSRRAVARGVAWTVPVAAVSVAAPAFALSGPAPTAVITSICTCTSNAQGRKYRISVTFTNTIAQSFYISAMSVATGNISTLGVTPATTFTISAVPGPTVKTFDFTRTNSSSALPLTFTFTAKNNSNNVTTIRTTPQFNTASTACATGLC